MTPQLPAGWPGYLIAIVTVVITFLVNWRKGRVDESALILGKWKDLVDAHEAQIKRLNEDFDAHREEARAEGRRRDERIALLERENGALKVKIAALEDENAGLKRMIAQNSQSTAHMIGRPGDAAVSKANPKDPK